MQHGTWPLEVRQVKGMNFNTKWRKHFFDLRDAFAVRSVTVAD